MKIIIWDHERDREYKFRNVSEERLEDCLERYKQIYRKWMREVELYQKVDSVYKKSRIFLCVALSLYIAAVANKNISISNHTHSLDNQVPFNDDNNIIIGENELEEICEILEKKLGVTIADDEKDEYLLLDAINKNASLTTRQKEFCYQYINLFMDNQYLDKKEVYNSLLNVEVKYTKRPKDKEKEIKGIYRHFTNEIEIYEADLDKNTLTHELIHCISGYRSELPRFFDEGMTELLSNEYFSENPFYEITTYPYETIAIKMLCEATSSDAVLKAYTYGDMSYIIDEMVKYTGDKKEMEDAINMLSVILDEHIDGKELSYTEEEVEKTCISKIRMCAVANAIYNNKNTDDYSYFYNEMLFRNIYKEDTQISLYNDISDLGYYQKAYFSSKLKKSIEPEFNHNSQIIKKKIK